MTQDIQEHILKKYEVLRKIGSGAYGHVWKIRDRKTDQVFALKKIFDAFQHATDAQRTYRQIMFLRQFEHANVIRLLQVFRAENDKDMYLVFEFMEADLHYVIRQNILEEVHKQYILYQLALALRYLHSGQAIHRDIKPSNVLLSSDSTVKLCDFGLVRSLAKHDDQCPVLTEGVATRWYRAPEILLGSSDYTKAVDMWSLGCVLAEIMLGKPIFQGNSTLQQLEKILTFTGKPSQDDIEALKSDLAKSMIEQTQITKYKTAKETFPYCPDNMVDLVTGLLQFNPNKRLTAEQVLRHPYVKAFAGKGSDSKANNIFKVKQDQQKLATKDYKQLIYEAIKQDRHHSLKISVPKKQQLKLLTSQNQPQQPRSPTSPFSPGTRQDKRKPEQLKTYTPNTINEDSVNQTLAAIRDRKEKLQELMKAKKQLTNNGSFGGITVVKVEAQTTQQSKNMSSYYKPAKITPQFLSPKAVNTPIQVKPNSPLIRFAYGQPQELRMEQPSNPFYFLHNK